MKTLYKTLFLFFITTSICSATHLLGGNIRATNTSGLTYKIRVQLYFDAVGGGQTADSQNNVLVCFGDGNTAQADRISYTELTGDSKSVSVGIYELTHTYPSTGVFQISSSLTNRTDGMLNYSGHATEMFLWTVINTSVSNNTPELPDPLFSTGAKQVLKIDLKPINSDSDSTSAHLQKLSSPSPGTCGVRLLDYNYVYPNDVSKTGTFSIDQADKKLIWNAPEALGKYVYSVVIDEWRNGIKISETYREGVIVVVDKPGPTVEIPPYVPATESGIITSNPDKNYDALTLVIEAYPVPTQDYLTVKVSSKNPTTLKIQLINLEGTVIKEIKTSAKSLEWSEQLDLRQTVSGLYIIKAVDETGKTATKKIVR
ncbi:T9SS type A sorting domain-containing protein [Dyadobacter sp. LHD-138]|uniref:T9SS type A sorting domain-containing protein n=1 Tax=Dyadobacter sp. LHD-138 TaxID=3071413 RepID=UPI0027DEB112|nr:T9SS type A sorting domain-containing protein [Dyadobacter sp. LHD-138]MDQ6480208.1 T9SS type A sorting domain-containing protein [Dyadobacter sp. LHD-138]